MDFFGRHFFIVEWRGVFFHIPFEKLVKADRCFFFVVSEFLTTWDSFAKHLGIGGVGGAIKVPHKEGSSAYCRYMKDVISPSVSPSVSQSESHSEPRRR